MGQKNKDSTTRKVKSLHTSTKKMLNVYGCETGIWAWTK